MRELILTVDKVSQYIKNVFDSEELLQDIYIRGEVSNLGETGGNAYFVLKGREAQINCVYFAADLRKYIPKNGDMCVAKGSVSYYKKGGKVSFNVTDIRPEGAGDAYLKFLQLKDRLEKEGLFAESHKIPLPYFTGRLAVVTSRAGAVVHDIIKTAHAKYKGADILIYNVKVQGTGAEDEIARGISVMDAQNADVLIVARGGGSAEDLQPFNTETVARAVYSCKTPVISAVGHETDYTLCDMAADVRAATPTAAAEIAVINAADAVKGIQNINGRIYGSVALKFNRCLSGVKNGCQKCAGAIEKNLGAAYYNLKYKLSENCRLAENKFSRSEYLINSLTAKIEGKNPLKLLKSGYGYVTDEGGKAVKSAKGLVLGQDIKIAFSDGKITARVKETATEENNDI